MTLRQGLRIQSQFVRAGAVGLVTILTIPSVAAAGYFFRLGAPPGSTSEQVEVFDLSDDGTIVAGAIRNFDTFEVEAFRWTAETGFVRLGNLGGMLPYSAAIGISADGSVLVGSSRSPESDPNGKGWEEPMLWSESSGMVGLGNLEGGLFDGLAVAASADGSVIVGRSSSTLAPNTNGEAFRWTAQTGMVGLGVLVDVGYFNYSLAWGVSADGSVITGTARMENGCEAFRWTQTDGMVTLGDLPGTEIPSTFATDISADGSVIVGYSGFCAGINPEKAFRWTAATGMVDLGGLPGASDSRARQVSADGSVVVGSSTVGSEYVATIWNEAHGTRELRAAMIEAGLAREIEGWAFTSASAVAADNLTVLGSGVNPEGSREAFIVNLGPPSIVEIPVTSKAALAGLAVLLAMAGLTVLRRR